MQVQEFGPPSLLHVQGIYTDMYACIQYFASSGGRGGGGTGRDQSCGIISIIQALPSGYSWLEIRGGVARRKGGWGVLSFGMAVVVRP